MPVKMGKISCAYSLRNHEGILSGPLALLLLSELHCFVTPEIKILRGLMPGHGSFSTLEGSLSVSLVKPEENCPFRISALYCPSLNILPSISSLATPGSCSLCVFFSSFNPNPNPNPNP